MNYTDADWFFFVTEDTLVDFAALDESLSHFDPTSQELFLGHALSDSDPVIIHHFAPSDFISYPHIPSGVLLSRPALHRLAVRCMPCPLLRAVPITEGSVLIIEGSVLIIEVL